MKKIIQMIVICIVFVQAIWIFPSTAFAEAISAGEQETTTVIDTTIKLSVDYLVSIQDEYGAWGIGSDVITANIANILEYEILAGYTDEQLAETLKLATEYMNEKAVLNCDDLSVVLLIDELRKEDIGVFKNMQNKDGGFGLSKGYASDIIDTKLALKTLADLGETEAMNQAALYIVSLQNEDGGFSYQPGLVSNPELTAEIADILADCILKNPQISNTLQDSINKLTQYLDENATEIDELSKDDLSAVYQHFYTALFKLKTTGKYDVTSYYKLQREDGGVFDDPMATALFLELIVREENFVVAKLENISITNDKGYAVSSFNANENVNININSEIESEKAYLSVTIETPSGEIILVNGENLIWNTGENEEGIYTVKAEIIRSSNKEVLVSMTQIFQIEHKLKIDNVSLSLSQNFSRIGDEGQVSIYADVSLENFSEENEKINIQWKVESDNKEIASESKEITEKDLYEEAIYLGDFTPDTSERKTYIVTAEVLLSDLVVARSTTNYFVSDKGVALLTDVNKEYLYEASDDAEIKVKLRDERVVDLILTTSSENTDLIKEYAEKINEIKTEMETQGYIVNLCSIETSYLTAKDTFAWVEYDHPNYNTQSPYTKHIIYEGDNIKMTGYTAVPYKDFLLVPDDNASQKIFTFDIQRDRTDWHSMYGGGFLFNTVIEENTISGYYVLITSNGLKLYSLDKMNLTNFRNSSTSGTLLKTFSFSNLYDQHHIKISADNHTLSLWDGETPVIDNYELPKIYGNGYGPITSHASHGCSQRSYFTFANIVMQTITGEKLSDVLENYNFESQSSRYVINLSDNQIDNLNTEEEVSEVAQKIKDKNITFIGLGNDTNREQYKNLMDTIGENGVYYDYTEETTKENLNEYIINSEENKRIKMDDQIVATNLLFTGTLYDGSIYTKTFEQLCVGEEIEFVISTKPTNLTVEAPATILKDISLAYKDENNVNRTVTAEKITLPVITPDNKISNGVSTDKPEYSSREEVVIFDRIHNNFDNRTAKNLTNTITVTKENGEVVEEYTKELSEIMPKGYVEHQEIWNTADFANGNYTVYSKVYNGELIVAESSANITITVPDTPVINLTGGLTLSGKQFDVSDTITIQRTIENIGDADITNGQLVIKIIDTSTENVVYENETPLNLAVSETDSDSISFLPETDFSSKKGSEYLVIYEAVTEDGNTIPLAGEGFVLEGINVTIYFIDNTQEKWVKNDNAVMELVDNTYGHDHYMMTKIDDETWAAEVPPSAYNITFNRYDSGKVTQWNSWSAGGRDENNVYYADVAEHGHWEYVEEKDLEKYFHEGDIIYLDLSEFTSWENADAIMYANFSTASKAENGGSDIDIEAWKDSETYQPKVTDYKFGEHIYAYVVTKEDEGKDVLRFWRGNGTTLWNCSISLPYEEYKNGKNCIKVTGWTEQGSLGEK